VVRLWERPIEAFLTGPPALAPLVAVADWHRDMSDEELADVLRRAVHRLTTEAPPGLVTRLMSATVILTELRIGSQRANAMFELLEAEKESVAVRMLLDRVRADEHRKTLLRQGERKFGAPDPAVTEAVGAIKDLERLQRMADAILDAKSWDEFLATP
jgi:hypothetical protein